MGQRRGEIKELKGEFSALEKKALAQQEKLETTRGEFKSRQAEASKLQSGIQKLESEMESARRSIEQLSGEFNEASSRHRALSDLQENYEGYFFGVKEVMKASDRGELSGLLGVVAKLVSSKKEHEAAIEAALGGQIQDIIAESADNA
ncbi:MAG: hypothetical protein V2A74_07720, partial [bacterium]